MGRFSGSAADLAAILQSASPTSQIASVTVGNPNDKATWQVSYAAGFTPNASQSLEIANAIAGVDITSPALNIVAFDVVIARFTGAEYLAMQLKRVVAGAGTLDQQWDIAMVRGQVDLNTVTAQNFKAALVTAGVLTQARADVIFS